MKASEIAPTPESRRNDLSRDPRREGPERIPTRAGPRAAPPIMPNPHTMELARVIPPRGAMRPVNPKNRGNPVYENSPNSARLNSVNKKLVELKDRRSTPPTHPRHVTAIIA